MAKAVITFEDISSKSVTLDMDIQEVNKDSPAADVPSVALALATRAMFDTGLLTEAATVALDAIANDLVPTECILAYFNNKKSGGGTDGDPHSG